MGFASFLNWKMEIERKIKIKMMMKMEMMRKAERALRQDLNGLLQLSQYWSLPPSPPCWLKSPQQLHPNVIKMLLKILSHILHQMGIIYPLVQAKRREIEIILLVKKSTSFVEMSPES